MKYFCLHLLVSTYGPPDMKNEKRLTPHRRMLFLKKWTNTD